MSRPDVFMPLYIGDYLAGTSRLTTELHGAYLLLIMDYWMNGPLPDDDSLLCSITKMTPDAWSIARAKLVHYFSISDGRWMHQRIEEELAAATEKKLKAREKAKNAANERWHGSQSNAPSNAPSNGQAMLEECPSPSPSPSPVKTTNKDLVPSKDGTPEYSSEFERAWSQYPKRAGGNSKKAAYKKWNERLKQRFTAEDMTSGVIRYKKSLEKEGTINTKYVMQGATFFGPSEHFMESYDVGTGSSNVGYNWKNPPIQDAEMRHAAMIEAIRG